MSIVANQIPTDIPQHAVQPWRRYWILASALPMAILPFWLALPKEWAGPLHSANGLILCLLLLTSTATDLSRRKIYNWATYPAFVWALLIASLPRVLSAEITGIGFVESLSGGAACFALMLFPYCLARGGAGDVKLAAAIGALVGVESGLLIIAFTYIVAAVVIAGWCLWERGPLVLLSAMTRKLASSLVPQFVLPPNQQQKILLDQPIPLAGFFLIATLLVIFDVPSMLRGL